MAFTFSLACPSFVYPADYVDNVRHLAPFVDEIELLFFDSRFANSPPSPALVKELAQLARSGGRQPAPHVCRTRVMTFP